MQNKLLEVDNLSMHFGGIKALTSVSFAVEQHSISALIGPNGAGKTTLFNCLTGFYKPTHGMLHFYGKKNMEISKVLGQPFRLKHVIHPLDALETLYYKMLGGSHKVARNGIARTFQNIRLFKEMTVIENLLVAQHQFVNRNLISGILNNRRYRQAETKAQQTAYEWLDYFNLSDKANRLAGELSYGNQRHLEIARAMCTQPTLICLDEPAAGLNPRETEHLSELILKLRTEQNVTVLLIEHDMSMVMNISDHIVVLDHGEVICQGAPDLIKQDKRVIEAYLGIDDIEEKERAVG